MDTSITLTAPASPSKRLWVIWLLYFVQFFGVGAYFIYLNVYYRQAGMTGTQIGVITMASAIVGVFSTVVWGYVSDRTGKPRVLMAAGSIGSLIVAQFVPLAHTFWAFFVLALLGAMLTSSFNTLLDGATLAMLGSKSENYGRYRLGGSVGFLAASSVSGFVYDSAGMNLMFPVYAVIMVIFAGVALLMPAVPIPPKTRARAELGLMMRQSAWLVFAVVVFLVWAAQYAAILYLNVSLISLGATQGIIGVVNMAGALAELPFMAFGGWFIKRFGLRKLMIAAIVLMAGRYFLLGWMTDPTWAVAINMLNGPGFAFYAITAVTYARQLAPPSLMVTSQGLYNATMNLSGVVSALATGILFDQVGPNGIFFVMGASCAVALALFVLSALRARSKT